MTDISTIAVVTRAIYAFVSETGIQPNTIIVNTAFRSLILESEAFRQENLQRIPTGEEKFGGLGVVHDPGQPEPVKIAFAL